MPKIHYLELDSCSVNQHYLLSCVKQNYLLACCESLLYWLWWLQRPIPSSPCPPILGQKISQTSVSDSCEPTTMWGA